MMRGDECWLTERVREETGSPFVIGSPIVSCSACGIQRVCGVFVSWSSLGTTATGSRYRRMML